MVGRIYKGDYLILLQTICKNSGSHGFREEDCFMFSNVSLWELKTPGV